MSAPVSHHPLVVNTQDGSCWTRRAVTRDGRGLYALAGSVAEVPDEVLVSLAELAEMGITGSAFALPMPVGPVPRSELDQARDDVMGACLARWEEEQENARLRLALKSAQRGRREARWLCEITESSRKRWRDALIKDRGELKQLRAKVAELLAERHTTNDALADITVAERSANRLTALLAESEPPRIRKHHPDCAAVVQAGAPCTCPPDFTGEDPDDLTNEDGCTCPDTGRGEPHDVDCPLTEAPGPYDAVMPAAGTDSAEMRELRAALTGSPDGITQRIAPLQALREDPHDSPLHHDWRLGRDLPEMGGTR